jgi:hypothetical protein
LGHGTPTAPLTQKECYDIQKPVVNTILPKMGILRKYPHDFVFGTSQYVVLGLEHVTAYQEHFHL